MDCLQCIGSLRQLPKSQIGARQNSYVCAVAGGVRKSPLWPLGLESLNAAFIAIYLGQRSNQRGEAEPSQRTPVILPFQRLHTQATTGMITPAAFVGQARPLISWQSPIAFGETPPHPTPRLEAPFGESSVLSVFPLYFPGTSVTAVIHSKWISLTLGQRLSVP